MDAKKSMKKLIKSKRKEINEANKHTFSKEIQEVYNTTQSNPDSFCKTEKYLKAQRDSINRNVEELYEKHPNKPFKLVLIEILSLYPDFLPYDNVLKLVKYIKMDWMELKKSQKSVVVGTEA